METSRTSPEHIKRIIYLFLLGSWLLRLYQGVLLYQLAGASFVSVKADNSFWIYHALQIPEYILGNQFLGLFLDLIWLILSISGLISKSGRKKGLLMFAVFINYYIIYHSVATHHEHTLNGILFMLLLITISNNKTFILCFEALRYYVLFVMFSAFLWKLFRGSLFEAGQMSEILKHQHIEYITSYPDSGYSNFICYFISKPIISNLLWYMGWITEMIFIVGFFTKKYDRWLGILFLAFFVMNYILMNLCFIEFCIFLIVFWPWRLQYEDITDNQLY